MADPSAVILGAGSTALALVRALGRKGVDVYGVGLSQFEVALSSRYCRRLGACDPQREPQRLLQLLTDFGRDAANDAKPVLYPSGDETVAFIAQHHEALRRHYRFSKLDPETATLFLDKAAFHAACLKHAVPTPKTFFPKTRRELGETAGQIEFPCVVKPRVYHLWRSGHGLQKAVLCKCRSDLFSWGEQAGDRIQQFIVQEVVEGPEENIYVFAAYFDQTGRAHAPFVGQKVRQYPVGFGTTTMMRTAEAPDIAEMSTDFLQSLGYQGLCDVEYKLDSRDNTFRIIEVNPRLGRWYGIVEAAGRETMYASYLDLCGKTVPDQDGRAKRASWIFTCRDLLSLAKNPRWHTADAVRSYTAPRTWCIWAPDDINPFFAYFMEILSKGLMTLTKHRP